MPKPIKGLLKGKIETNAYDEKTIEATKKEFCFPKGFFAQKWPK
jgi:hypothetical protein